MKTIAVEAKLHFLRVMVGLAPPCAFVLRLYTNAVSPNGQSELREFVEAPDGGGYEPLEVMPSSWSWDGPKISLKHRWTFDGSKDMDVAGWYLTFGPAFVIGARYRDKKGEPDLLKVRRRNDWAEADVTFGAT